MARPASRPTTRLAATRAAPHAAARRRVTRAPAEIGVTVASAGPGPGAYAVPAVSMSGTSALGWSSASIWAVTRAQTASSGACHPAYDSDPEARRAVRRSCSTDAAHTAHCSTWAERSASTGSPRAISTSSSSVGCDTFHLLESVSQLEQSPPDVALHGAEGHLERAGDVIVRAIFDESHSEHGRSWIAHALQLVDEEQSLGPVGVVRGGRLGDHLGRERLQVAMGAVALRAHVGDAVLRDAHEPRRRRPAVGSEGGASPPGSDEDLLDDVLGVLPGAEGAQGDGVHERGPPAVHLGEGLAVPTGQPDGELCGLDVRVVVHVHRPT